MNFELLQKIKKIKLCTIAIVFILGSQLINAQTSTQATSVTGKQLTINAAQMAHQGFLYAQSSYFQNNMAISNNCIDTAQLYLNETLILLDSALLIATDSQKLAKKHTLLSKEFALNAIKYLNSAKFTLQLNDKRSLIKKATYNAENVTVEAYHASFYFKDFIKKEKPKVEEPKKDTVIKHITKLDVDQTLFTFLKEDINSKKETDTYEILKLTEELFNTKDAAKQAVLKTKLQKLELHKKQLEQKNNDAQLKLTTINKLIEERDKAPVTPLAKEETVFAKSVLKNNEEWNKQIKKDDEIPQGLVYQIQLGIYKNAVLPTLFKGLTPVYEKITEKGICYSTGIFEKFADSNEAKNYVVNMGLKDAFIVAYYNKKKITIAEALKLEKK